MIPATEIKAGAILRLDKEFFKVIEAVTHSGGGKAGSMVHFKLRGVGTGHVAERRFNPGDKVEEIETTRVKAQLLFREGDVFTFMNAETFDQFPIPAQAVGPAAAFLKENDECEVEFHEEKPLSILYPPVVALKVESAGAGTGDAPKEATLENGLTVLVPHFVKEGDRVHVDVETGKYLDRISDREAKGAKFTVAAPPQKEEGAKPAEPKPEGKAKPEKGKPEKK